MTTHRLGQRRSGDISRSQPRDGAIHIGVNHQGREQAAYLPCRRDLAAEPDPELRISGQFSPDDLHRDRPSAHRQAQEHPSHPAAAKPPDQPVRTDLR